MAGTEAGPTTELDPRFSDHGATAVAWERGEAALIAAEMYWISTMTPEGAPHTTPLIAVWFEGALHFCTGADERKGRNLAANQRLTLTTGTNRYAEGLDVVVEATAAVVEDDETLHRLAEAYVEKYGEVWRFAVRDGGFTHGEGSVAVVYRAEPRTAFGFAKGTFGQTRWRFETAD